MHKYIVVIFFIISFFCVFYLLKNKLVTTTMQYFPIDETTSFEDAKTDLAIEPTNNDIQWAIDSTSSEVAYLRQDVSLLYENGKFKGVQSKWRQHLDHLHLSKQFKQTHSSFLQAISFHHGEIHYPEDQIFSIQKMTSNQLYFIYDDKTVHAFHTPSNSFEKKWQRKLSKMTKQQLMYHWNGLIDDLNVPEEEYDCFPLTELVQYEHETLPGRTRNETSKIIGQLWEGLYKNYIVLLTDKKNQGTSHYVPLIMISKNNDHLLILFELNQNKQKLIQKIS